MLPLIILRRGRSIPPTTSKINRENATNVGESVLTISCQAFELKKQDCHARPGILSYRG